MIDYSSGITCVFVDIGGVLLTNGWDHLARRRAVEHFKSELGRNGKASPPDVRNSRGGKAVFRGVPEPRGVLRETTVHSEAVSAIHVRRIDALSGNNRVDPQLKALYALKIAVVSNESFELNAYRIRTFRLDAFVDCFVSSCFVNLRKPDANIFRLALNLTQAEPEQVLYIENTPMFVQIAEGLGIRSILHKDYQSTCAKLTSLGFPSGWAAAVPTTA